MRLPDIRDARAIAGGPAGCLPRGGNYRFGAAELSHELLDPPIVYPPYLAPGMVRFTKRRLLACWLPTSVQTSCSFEEVSAEV